MIDDSDGNNKIKLGSLVLMIFSAIFGFSNAQTAFYQMGYASVIWYVIAALFFFLPSALMFAEYGASFKEAKGGIYSWLQGSVGDKTAFVGTFIWLSAWIVWLVSSTQFFLVSISTMLFGRDTTQGWHIFNLSSNKTLGILSILVILVVTLIASMGLDKISKIASFGGIFAFGVSVLFVLASIAVVVMHHGQLAQPINGIHGLTHSPNASFATPIAIISFLVYAIFAYGGLETTSGVIDSVDKPGKTYPRALIISMILMTLIYVVCIFACGASANWHHLLGKSSVNLANVEYVLINNLGYEFGRGIGLSSSAALMMGKYFSQFTGLSDVLCGIGAAFVMIYSPIKSFVLGCESEFMPKKMKKLNKHGMPAFSMWMQAIVVCGILFFTAFGGNSASSFYTILTDMMNVSSAVPYLFLVGAFPFFKLKQNIDRPFVFYKRKSTAMIVSIIVWIVLALGILFTCVQPILDHDYMTAFWTAFGPVLFGAVAWIYYTIREIKDKRQNKITDLN
ncbi:MAG: glutamate/gamma-aminobutyrate family transporter YjeM [Firmicutes bacterium]|uniref:Glutamate/gamma-aminobutyrate family transporter YjeM n=1 Tax=Candidatus Gallilactobacillus intestinavium TaxID=2840838 RepID=A0A9D9E766_9LACO|nr:glutamate/gamma-aminobutyrate family transporter YjeM [Candidatus Gallilactobacillus intestinavium]